MTAPEAASRSGADRHLPTSRRSFLLLAGSSAGVGLSAGTASGAGGEGGGDPVAVVASPPQRGGVRDAVEGLQSGRSAGGGSVSIELDVLETTAGLRRFTAGDVDVLVGSRPILPAERSLADENDVDYERRELPTAAVTLRHPESSWVDPLRPARLAEAWADDGVVDTWAEVDPRAEAKVDSDGQPSGEPNVVPTTGDPSEALDRPALDGTVLVRGVRAHQYATGFGGVGYYEPVDDWLRPKSEGAGQSDESHTPLVRLAFLYADRESLGREPAADFVRAYADRNKERVGEVPYLGDPFGSD